MGERTRLFAVGGAGILLAATLGCAGNAEVGGNSFFGRASVNTGSSYTLTRKTSGKCLDITGLGDADGTKIEQYTCNGGGNQIYRVDDDGNGGVVLVNPRTNKCVDVSGAGTDNGTQVQLWSCNGSDAQSWTLENMGSGYTRLRNPNSDRCLDVSGAATNDGAKVQIWSCNHSSAQAWQFAEVAGDPGTPPPTPPPPPPPPPPTPPPPGNGGGTTINGVYITWYGFNDNSCQVETQHNCNTIAFPQNGGFPTKHDIATEGSGTYDDPNTFATGINDSGTAGEILPGTIIYVPEVRKYFVMEDSCLECTNEWNAQQSWHVDLWMGPSYGSDNASLMSCEDNLTLGSTYAGTGTIIIDPPSDLPVDTTPLFTNNTCTAHTY